ncbi:hypothetical protein Scep_022903 [Stephania cephalantha]|uniref:Bet v I/Major latex protein domain-containing protein n=1 Tax=Stephania cephalantha TaxID=152367 RepID=A0AAP0FJC3_9MAGN
MATQTLISLPPPFLLSPLSLMAFDGRGGQISLSFLPATSGLKRGEAGQERRGGWPTMVNDDGDAIGGRWLRSGGHGGGNDRGGGKWWIEEEDKEFTLMCYKSIEFVEGNGRTVGSVMIWKYVVVSEKEGGGSLVKWFVEFDKANEAVPSPNHFMNLLDMASKKLDAYLLKA